MNYKLEGALRRNRKNFIIFAILWVFIAVVLVSPIAYSYHMATVSGEMNAEVLVKTFGSSITDPLGTFGAVFT